MSLSFLEETQHEHSGGKLWPTELLHPDNEDLPRHLDVN